jgi:hypothetical protein
MSDHDPFVDVGPPLSPADADALEYELGQRGIVSRLRLCDRGADGDRQAVQVARADVERALVVRDGLFPAAPEAPPASRSNRLRNGIVAGVLGLVASMRVVRLVRVPKGGATAVVILGIAAALFAAAFGMTKEPPGPGP